MCETLVIQFGLTVHASGDGGEGALVASVDGVEEVPSAAAVDDSVSKAACDEYAG